MVERFRAWEYEGAELDLLVAEATGIAEARIVGGVCMVPASRAAHGVHAERYVPYRPSSTWDDGGPIVEQQKISVWRYTDLDSWHACTDFDFVRTEGLKAKHYCQGATPLVAAMRCFVASSRWTDVP